MNSIISFIVPAHNEESHLPATLTAIHSVRARLNQPSELIVVNDASTDRTAQIAAELGAAVIDVRHQQIAATRNSGARSAQGNYLFFIDADTRVSPAMIAAALEVLHRGAAGGGFLIRWEGQVPWWAKIIMPLVTAICRRLKVCGGACLFCTRSCFDQVGGFDEVYYAAEDVAFVQRVKRVGRFCIPRELVTTSSRKFDEMSFLKLVPLILRLIWFGPESFRSKRGLEHWYSNAVRRS